MVASCIRSYTIKIYSCHRKPKESEVKLKKRYKKWFNRVKSDYAKKNCIGCVKKCVIYRVYSNKSFSIGKLYITRNKIRN